MDMFTDIRNIHGYNARIAAEQQLYVNPHGIGLGRKLVGIWELMIVVTIIGIYGHSFSFEKYV